MQHEHPLATGLLLEAADAADSGVREIDTGTPPTRFARGWHCLGLVGEFADGKPHSVQIFGTKLVVWTDTSGQIQVLDAYCRHMGGDLSQGSVKGDNVACPFHGWLWKGNGRCAGVPYAKRNPKLAKTRAWPTMVRNGQVFVYRPDSTPAGEIDVPERPLQLIFGGPDKRTLFILTHHSLYSVRP